MVSAITTGAEMTLAIARAGGRDAGDRSMRKAGRKAWSWDDWNGVAAVGAAAVAVAVLVSAGLLGALAEIATLLR